MRMLPPTGVRLMWLAGCESYGIGGRAFLRPVMEWGCVAL